jgi:2-amino-4-hydroxy-6-hydroxymethyldihydropteridine diphosphokinase
MKANFLTDTKNKDIYTLKSMEFMNKAYLLIGGNEGDRFDYLKQAREYINTNCGKILVHSAIYETSAWGNTAQAAFLNQALLVETVMNARFLMKTVLDIEKKMGRTRMEKYGPRIIDIDILFFDKDIIEEEGLVIPHPQLQDRRFVLEPMNEIAPGFGHPLLHKTIHTLLAECPDKLDVKKLVQEI